MFRKFVSSLAMAIIIGSFTIPAYADALPSLSMLGLFYSGAKSRISDDALKAKLADVDTKLWAAYRSGRTSEVRRELARGLSLAAGRGWSEEQDFDASLVVRTSNAFVDPTTPLIVRLEQIYPSTLIRTEKATGQVTLHRPGRWTRDGRQPGEKVHDLGGLPEVGLDLVETPVAKQIDLTDVADGDYDLRFELFDGEKSLGSASTPLRVRKGLAMRITRLRRRAAAAPEDLQADILYPLDYMRKVSLDLVSATRFNIDDELAAAEATAAAAGKGKDPFKDRTGDFERHYLLKDAEEIMPYRIYVPEGYNPGAASPLVVALHGLGGNEDSMFGDWYGITRLAESRGYIVVSPMGFRPDGGYGSGWGAATRKRQFSEQDVMEVLARMRGSYAIDPGRIYLLGHSMGAIGTWYLAAKYPDIWAALAPIAGRGNPKTAEKIRHIPQIVVHGDADTTVPVSGSRQMVEALRKLDAEIAYIEVPGGGHGDVAPANMDKIFDFFDSHRLQRKK